MVRIQDISIRRKLMATSEVAPLLVSGRLAAYGFITCPKTKADQFEEHPFANLKFQNEWKS